MQAYENYKDSGIDWIGQIPEHWEVCKLGNILKPYSVKNKAHLPLLSITREKGVILRGDDPEESNHNFIPDDLSGYKHIKKGQFGMNKMKAWQGSYGYSNFEGIVSPAYYIFDISEKLYGDYFSKTIRSNAFIPFFIKASDGVRIGQWDLSKPRMKEIPFYIPPIQEQVAIANFLDDKTSKIDALVQTKEQQIEKLKELRQAKIHQAVTKGLDANAPTKDSGVEWIGEIPAHWEVKPLRYLGITQNGLSKGGEAFGKGTPFVSYSDVYKNASLPDNVTGLVEVSKDEIDQYSVKKGDVFFTRTSESVDDIGFSSVALENILDATFAGFLIRFRPVGFKLLSRFSMYYFRSVTHRPYLVGNMNIVIRASLSQELLKNLTVLVPPIQEQEAIVAYLDEVTSKIDQAIAQKQEQVTKLKEYKQSLINDVVTGKVKVC